MPTQTIVDFHSHTDASDGTLPPAQLIAKMRARGVKIFSVTDHDTLAAYEVIGESVDFATLVPGVELNTTYKSNEVHILGYGLPLDGSPLTDALAGNRAARARRAEKMVEQLRDAGVEITIEDVRAEATPATALGRPHVAKALMRKGIARGIDDAFRRFLGPQNPGFVPSTHLTPKTAISLIARSGGVPVLAHPGRLKNAELIDELVEYGLVGLEVFYPTHSANQISEFRAKAAEHGLVMTAGSDFHDPLIHVRGVGMEVDRDDLVPFLELLDLPVPDPA